MKKELEIEQSVSFSQEDFSSDMKNNIVQAIDPTGNVLAIDTWKYAIYIFLIKYKENIYQKNQYLLMAYDWISM